MVLLFLPVLIGWPEKRVLLDTWHRKFSAGYRIFTYLVNWKIENWIGKILKNVDNFEKTEQNFEKKLKIWNDTNISGAI